MSVIRVVKDKNYTVMSNHHLKDEKLSLKAKGLLSVCLSLPDNWDYSIAGLVKISKEGKASITSALKELEKVGYLRRKQIRDEQGRIVDLEYIITEYPADPYPNKPDAENPDTVIPNVENPDTENPTELNTDRQNTDTSITNPIRSDREVGRARQASARQRVSDDWSATKEAVEGQIDYCNLVNDYPRRKGDIDELVMITSEALCSGKPTLRVNGEERPAAMVKERLKMLRYDHIRYVLQSLQSTPTKTRKPNQYLLTTLYNAPATINTYYNAEAIHDMYGVD